MDWKKSITKVRSTIAKQISIFNAADLQGDPKDEELGVYAPWFFSALFGQPRNVNVAEIRSFAMSPWAGPIIAQIINRVKSTPWDIVPVDEKDDIKNHLADRDKLRKFFNKVNRDKEDIMDIYSVWLKDVLEIDAGVHVKGRDGTNQLRELWFRDGGTYLIQRSVYGPLLKYFQYSFRHMHAKPIPFEPDDVIYGMANPSSYRLYGFSPMQFVQQVVDTLIQSLRYNRLNFKNNMIPDGLVSMPGFDEGQLKKFKAAWEKETKGKPHKLVFVNHETNFARLTQNNKDMEWLAGQQWYYHLVFASFGTTPADLGFDQDVNRSTQAGQERSAGRNGINPKLMMIDKSVNRFVVPDFLQQEEPKVKFKFINPDLDAEKTKFDQDMKAIENGALTINEYRSQQGLDSVEWGDEPMKQSSFQFNGTDFGNGQDPNAKPGDDRNIPPKKEPKNDDKKSYVKKEQSLDAGDDIEEEADTYDKFLNKLLTTWENRIIKAIENDDEIQKSYSTKSLKDLMAVIFNTINTSGFIKLLNAVVKKEMKVGLEEAETELNIDIGISEAFRQTSDYFADQQLTGYILSNGKKWHGISGASKELQMNIFDQVTEGVTNKESQKEITKRVKGVFTQAKDFQALRIARTETTRFVNEGKLRGIRDAKVGGFKTWKAHLDDRTSDICKRLNGQKVEIDENFIDPLTKVAYHYPPALSNCLDKKTEVYTKEGWMLFKDLEGKKIKIWSLNPETLNPEWVDYVDFVKYKSKTIVKYKSKLFDMAVTPNHNQFVKFREKQKGRKDHSIWKLVKDKDLPNHDFNFYKGVNWNIRVPDTIKIAEDVFSYKAFARFMGWYLSEGSHTKGKNHIKISQEKESTLPILLNDMEELHCRVEKWTGGIYVFNKALIDYCEQFGKSYQKFIPDEIKNASSEIIEEFLDAFCLGDGSIKKDIIWNGYPCDDQRTFFTSSKRMADDLGELLMKIGRSASYTLRKVKGKEVQFRNGIYTINHDLWVIYDLKILTPSRSKMVREEREYNDYVYDVELEKNHVLLTRRNGKIVWTGNCRSTFQWTPN